MFPKMRREAKAFDSNRIEQLLKEGEYLTLSMVDEQGHPYGVPLSYAYANGVIYLHGALEGHKINCITKNNRVSATIVGKTQLLPEKFSTLYESVIVFGKAHVLEEAEEKKIALAALIEKYSGDFYEEGMAYIERAMGRTCAIKIDIEHMTGKGTL